MGIQKMSSESGGIETRGLSPSPPFFLMEKLNDSHETSSTDLHSMQGFSVKITESLLPHTANLGLCIRN